MISSPRIFENCFLFPLNHSISRGSWPWQSNRDYLSFFLFLRTCSALMHGLGCWFDISFIGSSATVVLSTAPERPGTHWYQVGGARRETGKYVWICLIRSSTLRPPSCPLQFIFTTSVGCSCAIPSLWTEDRASVDRSLSRRTISSVTSYTWSCSWTAQRSARTIVSISRIRYSLVMCRPGSLFVGGSCLAPVVWDSWKRSHWSGRI